MFEGSLFSARSDLFGVTSYPDEFQRMGITLLCSGERRLRRSSAHIIRAYSDKGGFV